MQRRPAHDPALLKCLHIHGQRCWSDRAGSGIAQPYFGCPRCGHIEFDLNAGLPCRWKRCRGGPSKSRTGRKTRNRNCRLGLARASCDRRSVGRDLLRSRVHDRIAALDEVRTVGNVEYPDAIGRIHQDASAGCAGHAGDGAGGTSTRVELLTNLIVARRAAENVDRFLQPAGP